MALNDGLTGFELTLSNMLIDSEIGQGNPYQLNYVAFSGTFSFGGLQWDLPNHTPLDGAVQALDIFEEILSTAVYPEGAVDEEDESIAGQRIISDEEIATIRPLALGSGDPNALDIYIIG